MISRPRGKARASAVSRRVVDDCYALGFDFRVLLDGEEADLVTAGLPVNPPPLRQPRVGLRGDRQGEQPPS